MINKHALTKLYSLYLFEKTYEDDYGIVYTYNSGYFNNAEIVIFDRERFELKRICDEYTKMGFSVRDVEYKTIEEAHEKLFEGFFKVAQSNLKLSDEYAGYCALQSKKMCGSQYNYINGKYYIDGEQKEGSNVTDEICDFFCNSESRLIILEAAAGFGKTCASFEVINKLTKKITKRVPILAELSKSRHARIFKHVLYAEIDQKFPSLSSPLVISEIKNGRVPLIIDGFDELLSKSMLSAEEVEAGSFEDVQTMLDTIAELFCEGSKAQILLTSRKSSIFAGAIFDEWVESRLVNCDVVRIELGEPTVQQWIGKEKTAVLEANSINIDAIANPVLLTIIRNTPIKEFEEKFSGVEALLNRYFTSLLEREKSRQSLPLSIEEQYDIMCSFAAWLVCFDISAEDPSFLKDIFNEILRPMIGDIEERYAVRFSSEDRPTDDEFVMKLVNHALLDRVTNTTNKIGFINEFIFGLFIGESIVKGKIKEESLGNKYISIAVTAYCVKSDENKIKLYERVASQLAKTTPEFRLATEVKLLGRIDSDYAGIYIEDNRFCGVVFDDRNRFTHCTFNQCVFFDCKILPSTFTGCTFVNCRFYNIEILGQIAIDEIGIVFSNCVGSDAFGVIVEDRPLANVGQNYEKLVLEQYWKPGYEQAELRRTYRTLFRGTQTSDQQGVADAINSLKQQGYLTERSHCLELNFNFINEIKGILGR